jgi:hypothetical protein
MRDLKFIIGLLAFAVFAGGCIMEPLDPESDEEDIGSVTEGVNTVPPPATPTGVTPTTSPVIDGVRSNRSSVGSEANPFDKPQPDPWLPARKTDESNTTPTAP